MSNPFEPPASSGGNASTPPGTFDIAQAFTDGWDALTRNLVDWLIGGLLALVAVAVGIVFCVLPGIIVGIVMTWGFVRFALDAVAGDARWQTIFEPFNRFGEVFLPMLLLVIFQIIVSIPGQIGSGIISGIAGVADDPMIGALGSLLGIIVSMLWGVVIGSRFLLAPFLIVDGGLSAVDAFRRSWDITGPVWVQLMLFVVATAVVGIIGLMLCFVGVIPASIVTYAASASVYRQLIGRG